MMKNGLNLFSKNTKNINLFQRLFARNFFTLPKYNNTRVINSLQISNQISQTETKNTLFSFQTSEFTENISQIEGREIYVGNLSWSTDEESLADFCNRYGDVEKVSIAKDPEGRSKGFGFVKFYDAADVQKLLSEGDNVIIDGRQCRVNLSKSATGNRPARTAPVRNQERSAESECLFVGNLSFDSTEASIRDFFADSGEVVDVRISYKESGNHKGFCHVQFDSVESSSRAIQKNGESLDGRGVRLDFSAQRRN
jgi:nucleolin